MDQNEDYRSEDFVASSTTGEVLDNVDLEEVRAEILTDKKLLENCVKLEKQNQILKKYLRNSSIGAIGITVVGGVLSLLLFYLYVEEQKLNDKLKYKIKDQKSDLRSEKRDKTWNQLEIDRLKNRLKRIKKEKEEIIKQRNDAAIAFGILKRFVKSTDDCIPKSRNLRQYVNCRNKASRKSQEVWRGSFQKNKRSERNR